jgi:glutathione S-transferase
MTPKLFYFPGNANLAPHMVLEELGAPYELVLVDRAQNAHKSAEYMKLNPMGRIPTYVEGDLVISETAAICLHLADKHPAKGLAPALGSPERGRFYSWLMYLTNTVQAEMIFYFYPEKIAAGDAARAEIKAAEEARVGGMFDTIEETLAGHGGPYLLGQTYSLLDPYLLMLGRWTRGMKRPARTLPHVGAFMTRMLERPAVKRAFEQEELKAPLI